jgi:hypothetical protein
MDCMIPSRSTIKLFIVIVLSLLLSCVTAPGIRTSDVAKLHYGDREDAVVEMLGDGRDVIYFKLEGKKYRYRLYTTQYTKDVYALLFMEGSLVAVHNNDIGLAECLVIDVIPRWEGCLSERIDAVRPHKVSFDSHNFSEAIDTERKEQSERNKYRGGAFAVAVPLTVVLPGIVPMYCFLSCGEGCKDPGARPGDYEDRCVSKLADTQHETISIIHGDIDYVNIDHALGQLHNHKDIIYDGETNRKTTGRHKIIDYYWDCTGSVAIFNVSVGLENEQLEWARFRINPMNKRVGSVDYTGCEGTWSEIKKCVEEKPKK